jgi:hypothetical protein
VSTERIDIVVASDTGARTVKRDFDDLGNSAEGAAKSHGHHTNAITEVKREMAGTQRTVNFFARALNDIVPASSAAGEGLRVLGAGIAGGLGMGLGIEIILAGVKLIGDKYKEWAEKTQALKTAHLEFTQVSQAELLAWEQVAERVAEAEHRKFTEVFKELSKGAQEASLAMQKALNDYELSLHKLSPAQKLVHEVDAAGLTQRKLLTDELYRAELHLADVRKKASSGDAGVAFAAGPDLDKQRREARALSEALHEVKTAREALAEIATRDARGSAVARTFVTSEASAQQGDELVAYTRESHRIEVQTAMLTASERRRIELETDESVLSIRKEWVGKNQIEAGKLEQQAIELGAAKKLELQIRLEREQATAIRALKASLATGALTTGGDGYTDSMNAARVSIENGQKLAAVDDQIAKAKQKKDEQAELWLGDQRLLIQQENAQRLQQAEFKDAQAANNRLEAEKQRSLDIERDAVDQEIEIDAEGLRRRNEMEHSPLFAGTQGYAATQLRQTKEMYAQIADWRARDLINDQTAQQMKAKVAAQVDDQRLKSADEFFNALSSLSNSNIKELAAVGKAAAITDAMIQAYVGMNKALGQGGFFGFVMAAAVGAVAFANVAKIAGFQSGGYSGDFPVDRVAGVVHGREFVTNAAATSRYRPVLEAMNAGTLSSSTLSTGSSSTTPVQIHLINEAPHMVSVQQTSAGEIHISSLEQDRALLKQKKRLERSRRWR